MKTFTAKNAKQLNLCLRLMHAEKISFIVKVCETNQGKIYFQVDAAVSEDKMIELEKKYRILIS